ncbi:MAG TPA: hypothetical protein VFD67_16155 [Gemmatimonadaceae bacterium]|nr:hypothetical protein [Gemmatimonadaceae bacterium]
MPIHDASSRDHLPVSVAYAVGALATAWLSNAAALAINQLLFHGSGIGPGPIAGIASLAIQAAMIVLLLRGNNVGRALVVVFVMLAAVPLPLVSRLAAGRSTFSAAFLVFGFLLKAAALVLLFSADSRRWFAYDRHNEGTA